MNEPEMNQEEVRYKKKPITVKATQWFKLGDHEAVKSIEGCSFYKATLILNTKCGYCGKQSLIHGIILTLEGLHIVCPSDWIITGIKGEVYPVKDEIFKLTYEIFNEG